ncbi:hypothetical protein ACFMPD_05075 [Sedimentitalea sp. HM32M-2]|uniref:hypothetical protein n=1 Tax=Sedimentitalea sp. HM32M-2 TaxID=3351566 RepID=UPI00363F200F
MARQAQQQVRYRRVFYIPGYDPNPPRRYRELYRTEAARQAKISGYEIDLKAKTGNGAYGWQVQARIDGAPVHSEFEVLVWSDLVQSSMSGSIPATYLKLLRTVWTYVASGTLRRLMWLRKGPVIAALYPIGMLLLQLLLACLLAGVAASVLQALAARLPGGQTANLIAQILSLVVALAVLVLALRGFRACDGRLFAYYLMQDYAHAAQAGGAYPPDLEQRIAAFADIVAAALNSDADEVLVVGHSSGAHIGVSLLADLIRAGRVSADGPVLGFLSLGQVVPMVSFLKQAHRLRADLRYLSTSDALCWVDVSAPGDGCSFALCDPVAVSGVAGPGKKWPLVISAAFTQTLSPERWAALRWRFFRLHFQYLCAFDRPGDYDYFRITAGPQTLAGRFAGRAASRSRIDVAASKYTSVAA